MPVYIDPTSATNGAGTLSNPRNTWAGLTLVAGETYLQKRGTTFSGRISSGVSGTSSNRITLGVYEASSGAQVLELGAATVRANGDGTAPAISASGDFVSIVGFDAQNAGGSELLIRCGLNDGPVVEYCRANGGGSNGITLYGNVSTVGIVARFNEANLNTSAGVTVEGTPSAFTNVNVSWNTATSNGTAGVYLIPYAENIAFVNLQAVGNVCTSNVGVGLRVTGDISDGIILGNRCTGNATGLSVEPYSASATKRTRVQVAGNVCNENVQFGIHMVRAVGWTVRRNECNRNGTNTGDKYGRGIELVGDASGLCAGLVTDNDCHENYNYGGTINNGTEGVGIGVDDYCGDVVIRGNRCYRNEGNGIQLNPADAGGTVTVEGNLLIDNFRVDATRAAAWSGVSFLFAQISTAATQNNAKIRGNTLINNGTATCWYGIAEQSSAAGTGTDIRNNVVMGHPVAGLKVRTGITRTHNALSGNAKNVESNADTTTLSNGTSAVTGDLLLTAEGAPMTGSPVLRVGVATGRSRDVRGVLRHPTLPTIGAYEPARMRR